MTVRSEGPSRCVAGFLRLGGKFKLSGGATASQDRKELAWNGWQGGWCGRSEASHGPLA